MAPSPPSFSWPLPRRGPTRTRRRRSPPPAAPPVTRSPLTSSGCGGPTMTPAGGFPGGYARPPPPAGVPVAVVLVPPRPPSPSRPPPARLPPPHPPLREAPRRRRPPTAPTLTRRAVWMGTPTLPGRPPFFVPAPADGGRPTSTALRRGATCVGGPPRRGGAASVTAASAAASGRCGSMKFRQRGDSRVWKGGGGAGGVVGRWAAALTRRFSRRPAGGHARSAGSLLAWVGLTLGVSWGRGGGEGQRRPPLAGAVPGEMDRPPLPVPTG